MTNWCVVFIQVLVDLLVAITSILRRKLVDTEGFSSQPVHSHLKIAGETVPFILCTVLVLLAIAAPSWLTIGGNHFHLTLSA